MTAAIDQPARNRALDTKASFIVQAPAGSGKTELLTQRYLALLAEVDEPEAILAITFTRKAAREMRERIIQALNQAKAALQPGSEPGKTRWQLSQKVLARNKALDWRLLDNPQRMQILTIDGFNSSLIKRMPSLSGLGADAQTDENAQDMYEQAADQTLELLHDADHGALIEQFMLHLDGNQRRAKKLLASMLAKRDQWQEYLVRDSDMDYLRDTIEASLEQVVAEEITLINAQINQAERDKLSTLATYALQNLKVSNKQGHLANIINELDKVQLQPLITNDLRLWRDVAAWLLTDKKLRKKANVNLGFPAKGTGADTEEKALFAEKKQDIEQLYLDFSDRAEILIAITKLPDTKFEDEHWQHLTDLIQCLKLALAELKILFSQRDRLDFQEVSIRALKALDVETTDLALILDYQIQHILIDEFQDTSQAQYRLIESLIREWQPDEQRSLFLVGDPMQSIYRFREADVGLFLKASQTGIKDILPEPLSLSVNFRSNRPIVDWVNNTFAKLFPDQQDIYRGAVSYSHSDAGTEVTTGQVSCFVYDSPEAEAEALTQQIQTLLTENPNDTTAVLVRNRKQLLPLIAALQKAGQGYQATDIEVLGKRPVISDLLTLLRALQNPADRIAWLGMLRAPWCGLTVEELAVMADSRATIPENMQDDALLQRLAESTQARLQFVLDKVLPWHAVLTQRPLSDVLEACWTALDGPAYVVTASDIDAAEVFFEMLANITLGGLYVDPSQIALELERLFAPSDPQGDKYLQIMTIHKSKGLEFDNVILPNMNARGANDDKTLLRWMTVPDGLLLAPLSFSDDVGTQESIYEYLRDIDKKRAEYERLRLIYVACTRAKSNLILSANTTFKDDQPKLQYDSMLQDLWPAIEADINYHIASERDDELPDSQPDNRLYRKHALDISLAAQHKVSAVQNTAISQTSIDRYPNASVMRRAIGTVTHRWLEYLADVAEKQSEDLTQFQNIISRQLQQLGVTQAESVIACTEVLEHLQQTLNCAMGQYILAQQEAAENEFAVERHEDSQVRYYVIDRTFIDADGTRWIIDYKTSSHEGAGRDDFLKEQRKNYNEQLENYASLFAAMESRPIKLMIYFTRYQKYELWDWSPSNNAT